MFNLFGPNKDEIWSQLAEEVGGEFIKGSLTKSSRLVTRFKQWTIILDTYTVSTGKTSVVYTRMRVPYISTDGFFFKIHHKNFFSGIGKLLRLQDVKTGDEEFDEAYIIKSNDEVRVRNFFARESIRYVIEQQPSISLEVKDKRQNIFEEKLPDKVRILQFQE